MVTVLHLVQEVDHLLPQLILLHPDQQGVLLPLQEDRPLLLRKDLHLQQEALHLVQRVDLLLLQGDPLLLLPQEDPLLLHLLLQLGLPQLLILRLLLLHFLLQKLLPLEPVLPELVLEEVVQLVAVVLPLELVVIH